MARMYHPKTGAEIDWVPDVDETIKVFEASGWKMAPEPEAVPGYEPEPTVYAPVAADAVVSERPAASAVRDDWAAYVNYLGGDSDGKTIAELKAVADELEGD